MPDRTLTVGGLTTAPGEKRHGVNEFIVQGQPYRLPMWLVNGAADGPRLVVTAGVHAAEYASIAAARDLGRALDPARFTLLDQFFWLRSAHQGFWYPSVPVGETVRKGQTLGCVEDVEGRVLQEAIAPADGCVLFIVASLAINDNDPLLAVGA